MPEEGFGFARVVIAVVIEEDDLAADLGLQAARGADFGDQKTPRKDPARLLTEADDRCLVHRTGERSETVPSSGCCNTSNPRDFVGGPISNCKNALNTTHTGHP